MKRIIVFLLIINLILLTGCWDMIEINERSFPYSVGVDLNHDGEDKYVVTFSHPNINAIGDKAIEDDLIHVISSNGNSIFDATEHLSSELYQPFYFKHLKVVIMSHEVAQNKQLLLEILDGIQRDFITNNNANLLLADSAKELLQFTTESTIQQAIEGTVYSILINNQNSSFFTPITASNFIKNMDQTGAAIIPAGGFEENVRIQGGSVFKDYEYVGDITGVENRSIAILNNEIGNVNVDAEHEDIVLSLVMTEAKSKKRLVDKKDLAIEYDVELEGHIHSHILDKEHSIDSEEMLGDLEEIAMRLIKDELDDVIKKLQTEFNSDVLFISDYLKKFHPSLWEEIEDDYDKIFPYVDIRTNVKVNIRRRGLIK